MYCYSTLFADKLRFCYQKKFKQRKKHPSQRVYFVIKKISNNEKIPLSKGVQRTSPTPLRMMLGNERYFLCGCAELCISTFFYEFFTYSKVMRTVPPYCERSAQKACADGPLRSVVFTLLRTEGITFRSEIPLSGRV